MEKLTKKYGLITAICMIVGIVIGSGVFFKASNVLSNTNGNIGLSLLVVAIVGAIMIICSFVFATLATKYEKVNGVVDYAEAMCGKRYAYYVGWFLSTIYYPSLTATLSLISARYTCVLFGWGDPFVVGNTTSCLSIACCYLVLSYGVNALSPKLAGKLQVSSTFIKLVPLVLMAIVGTILGLSNGLTLDAFKANLVGNVTGVQNNIFTAVCAFAFAYEGWIIATAINSELKNSKRNLFIALFFGGIIVVAVYLLYFLGLTGALSTEEMISSGGNLPMLAFSKLFNSPTVGAIVMVFVVISCLGTMNGLMLACCRGMYSIAVRNEGPLPKLFSQIDKETNIPHNSSIIGLVLCGVWLMQWQLFCFGSANFPAFWNWESDEISIVTLYAMYIPIFILMMIKCKELNILQRFIMPSLATICCIFMCYCCYNGYKANGQIWSYLLVFAVVMIIGFLFSSDFKKFVFKKDCVPKTEEVLALSDEQE